jgi:Mlc titration factor MtfA (ptsG expression regulator)
MSWSYLSFGLSILAGVLFIYLLFFTFYSVFIGPLLNFIYLLIPLKPVYRKFLSDKFPYYNSLNAKEKKKFRYRLKYFLLSKNFHGHNELTITDEMKIMIGASAVQISFGFQPLQLTSFDKIILYPEAYYSKQTKKQHKGEVNSRGMIVFSWEDFLKGYKISDNGYNVGLHEMAHALKIEDLTPNNEYAFLDEETLSKWHELSDIEIKNKLSNPSTFLRPYAYHNGEEFFAVCVEHFFEQPEEFKQAHPELYKTMAALLKQDPLERKR